MRRFVLVGVAIACAVTGPRVLPAQLAEVSPGARIRFRAPPVVATRITGTVLERRGDTLRVAPEKGSPFSVPISSFTKLDISKGKSRMEGAKVGALWSAGFYALFTLAFVRFGESCDASGKCTGERGPNAGEYLGFVAAGAVPGAMIGAFVRREKWERATLDARPTGAAR